MSWWSNWSHINHFDAALEFVRKHVVDNTLGLRRGLSGWYDITFSWNGGIRFLVINFIRNLRIP